MIHFSDSRARMFWESDGRESQPFSAYASVLMRKLRMLDAAKVLSDLRVPPDNRLEALHGNHEGQHSIRINGQYRICFVWTITDRKTLKSQTTIEEVNNEQCKDH